MNVNSPDVSVKLKQSSLKLSAEGNMTYSNMTPEAHSFRIAAATVDGKEILVSNVILTDDYAETFELIKNDIDKNMIIKHTPTLYTKRGGAYNLKFAVYPENAAVNVKPQYITVRATVIK